MKRFKFTLQKILDYKENIQSNETNILKNMRAGLSGLKNELESLISKYEDGELQIFRECQEGVSVQKIVTEKAYLTFLQNEIKLKELEIEKANHAIEAQIDMLAKIKTEKASVERLKDKEIEAYKVSEQKQDEIYISEFIVNTLSKQKG